MAFCFHGGEKDSQVKLRGSRVELGEIEYHLRQHSAIRDAHFLCIVDSTENQKTFSIHHPYRKCSPGLLRFEVLPFNEITC